MPIRGDNFASMSPLYGVLPLLASSALLACEPPDQGNLPLRRAVTKVRTLPEVETWAKAAHDAGAVVQYALRLDQPVRDGRQCYWPVDVNAEGKTWRRFYVTPDGQSLRTDAPGPGSPRR